VTQADTNGEIYSDFGWIREHPAPNPDRSEPVERPHCALVLGGASCVWDDLLEFEMKHCINHLPWDGLVIAANDVGAHWPRDLDHWVTLHSDKFPAWQLLRMQHGFRAGYRTWCRWYRPDIPVDFRMRPWAGGSSGMLAVQVALEGLGCTHVVLCGVPMTQTPHFAETTERFHSIWLAANAHWKSWEDRRAQFGDRVRSMSGRTRELFGAPSLEWFERTPEAGAPHPEADLVRALTRA
jgi:hypothetical protein